MKESTKLNADRFTGFADIYDSARPQMPVYVIEIIKKYLRKTPAVVIDLGSGTGLSALAWKNECGQVIGIEPSEDMIAVANEKQTDKISFRKGYSHDTGLGKECADVVICSQSFHWMEPEKTLSEVNRILKSGGIFAAVDCDWPPVCDWRAELAYQNFSESISKIEESSPDIKSTFFRWKKENHLNNIKNSGVFRFVREIVFANRESCDAERFIRLAESQGSLQTILKKSPELIAEEFEAFKKEIRSLFGKESFQIDFCYRMRIGIK